MDLGLQQKTVLVLASSKGIGKGIAEAFAKEGANVIITSRNEDSLKQTAAEINQKTNGKVRYKTCDLYDGHSIKDLVHFAVDSFGSIDILINNSGGPPKGYFEQLEDEDWQKAFELTFLSYIRAIREVLPSMKKSGGGKIINITSTSIKQPIDGLILSNAFRNAVVGLAKSLATELGKDNILINTIGPGKTRTDRLSNTEGKISKEKNIPIEEVQQNTLQKIPLGRYGTPEELAKTITFLCSEANTYITGQTLLIDGGMVKSI